MNIKELHIQAQSGSVVAQGILGLCYLYGRDVDVNYREALHYLSMAKDNGAARAVVNLGRMHAEGLGTPRDLNKAKRFYEAVEKVELRARLELARIYARGIGVDPNPTAAMKLYKNIAETAYQVNDPTTAAFVDALTSDEIEEAKRYLAKGE